MHVGNLLKPTGVDNTKIPTGGQTTEVLDATVIQNTSETNDGRRNQKPLTTTANVEDDHPDEEKIQSR